MDMIYDAATGETSYVEMAEAVETPAETPIVKSDAERIAELERLVAQLLPQEE